MKLRGVHIFSILAILGITAGYFAEPKVLELILPTKQIASKHTTKSDEAAKSTKKDAEIAKKENVDLGSLFDSDEPASDETTDTDEIADTSDTDVVDPSVFKDSSEDESEEETASRLKAFRKRPESDSNVVIVNETPYTGTTTAASWSQAKNFKRRLATNIRSRVKGFSPEQVETFIKDPKNRLELAQWHLLNQADEKLLTEAMKDKEIANQLAPLLNDLAWITGFVYDGEVKKPEVALAILAHLRQVDPKMDTINLTEEKGELLRDQHIKRRIAGAIAAEYSNNGWYGTDDKELSQKEMRELQEIGVPIPKSGSKRGKQDTYRLARERYLLFSESIDERLLNPYFYTMPNWLMRFTCGWKGDSAFGSANTMRWQRDNNSAPAKSYLGLGHVPYLPTNIFGDSIHGPYYYQPFSNLYPDNLTKMTRDIGSVCGGISHYGASAANANGIPAFTMGEPGHCAFAVYSEDKWVPCNSIFPEKFPHWSFWGDSTWSALQLYTNMYQDGQRTRDAQLVATLADLMSAYGNPNNSLKSYEISIAMQPINRSTWNSYVATAVKSLRKNPARWKTVNSFLCESMAPTNPSACATFLEDQIYPTMLDVIKNPKDKIETFSHYYENIKKQEENVWDIDKLLDMQYASLGRSQMYQLSFLTLVAKAACNKPEFGLALTWAIRTAFTNRLYAPKILAEVEKFRTMSPDIKLVDAAIIRAAEETNNVELFKKYSAPYMEGTGDMPTLPLIAGNLISHEGILTLSSYDDDLSQIVNHAAALTTNGGYVASEGGKHQTVTVQLPKAERIGAIIVVPAAKSASSYYEWAVEVSKDGQNWEKLTALPDRSPNPSVNLIINKNYPTAKYIRIDSGSDQTLGIKFKAILVYDNKKVK